MKKNILIIAAMAAIFSTAGAQENNIEGKHRHTETELSSTETNENVSSDTIRVYNRLLSRSNNTWNFNFLSISNENVSPSCTYSNAKSTLEAGIQDLYVGHTGLIDLKGFEQRHGSSLELGFNFLWFDTYNRTHQIGIKTALGLAWTRYMTRGNKVFLLDENDNLYCGDWETDKNYSKARLTYVSWRMPVLMEWNTKNQKFGISAGAELEYRHHIRSRVKCGNTKRYDVLRHDMDVNPWGCNLLGKISFGDVAIYGRYSLTPLFGNDHTKLEGTPYSIGAAYSF